MSQFCCHFHTRPCFTLLFHCGGSSCHFCCDSALSVFASKCQGVCHAGMAALGDLGSGILAGGILVSALSWCSCHVSVFLFSVWGHFCHDTQAVIMYEL